MVAGALARLLARERIGVEEQKDGKPLCARSDPETLTALPRRFVGE